MATLVKNIDTKANTMADRQRALTALLAFADAHYVTDPSFKFNRTECYDR